LLNFANVWQWTLREQQWISCVNIYVIQALYKCYKKTYNM
jgi:hypothetical protein